MESLTHHHENDDDFLGMDFRPIINDYAIGMFYMYFLLILNLCGWFGLSLKMQMIFFSGEPIIIIVSMFIEPLNLKIIVDFFNLFTTTPEDESKIFCLVFCTCFDRLWRYSLIRWWLWRSERKTWANFILFFRVSMLKETGYCFQVNSFNIHENIMHII